VSADPRLARLFELVRIGPLALPNRIVMAPMSRYLCPDGRPHAVVADYCGRRAAAGVGLIITEGTYVPHPSAAAYAGVPWFDGDASAGWATVVEAVHAAGGRIFPQLWHTGGYRRAGLPPDPDMPGLGPSETGGTLSGSGETTWAMTEREIADVVDAFARAATLALRLGFDGVEIHGAHGYLIDAFLWAETNRRTDLWGGDRRGRTRFACEVVRAIRAVTGAAFPISFRFSQWKQQDYRASLADTPAALADVLEPLADAGVTILHCSTRRLWEPAFADHGPMTLAGWAGRISGLPTIAVGGAGLDRAGLNDAAPTGLDPVLDPLARGEFDLLAVGRALLADPQWAVKIRDPALGMPAVDARNARLRTGARFQRAPAVPAQLHCTRSTRPSLRGAKAFFTTAIAPAEGRKCVCVFASKVPSMFLMEGAFASIQAAILSPSSDCAPSIATFRTKGWT
jgi:2,4-dienoyl-CoA reductase-like NADH-dependent reductase (Old Yellow Enzyme family)